MTDRQTYPPPSGPPITLPSVIVKGQRTTIEVDDRFLTIRGFLPHTRDYQSGIFFTHDHRSVKHRKAEKRIALDAITSVEFKESTHWYVLGYIRFTVVGDREDIEVQMSGNEYAPIRDFIERKIAARYAAPVAVSLPPPPSAIETLGAQLRQLAALREEGLLTDTEFDQQRAKLLDALQPVANSE